MSNSRLQGSRSRSASGSKSRIEVMYTAYHQYALRIIRKHLPGTLRRRFDSVDIEADVWLSVLRSPQLQVVLQRSDAVRQLLAVIAKRKVYRKVRDHLVLAKRAMSREKAGSTADRLLQQIPIRPETSTTAHDEQLLPPNLEQILPAEDYRVIAHRLSGMSLREIGRLLSIDEASVRRSLARSIRTTAKYLEQKEPGLTK